MKIISKYLLLLLPLNCFANNTYKNIFTIDSKLYKNSIIIEKNQENTIPECGTANGVSIELKPTNNLCNNGIASSVTTLNGFYNWNCQILDKSTSCSAEKIINTSIYSSCKDILQAYPELLGKDGVYLATVGGLNSKLYCNMTDHGGGWTLVLAQFENDFAQWNEGIQSDYDPSLSTNKAFTLNTNQLPEHSQISFSHSNYENKRVTNIFNYNYTTGNIAPSVIIKDILTNSNYHIHRDNNSHHAWHNPEESSSIGYSIWNDTLTIDKIGGRFFTFAFSINNTQNIRKGYAYNSDIQQQSDSGAWLIFVR